MTSQPPKTTPGQLGTFMRGQVPQDSPIVDANASRQGGQRRKTQSEVLITNNANGVYGSTPDALNANFIVQIPSTRLLVVVSWTYDPDSTEDTTLAQAVGLNSISISMDAWCELQDGRKRRANNLFTNRFAPNSWEAVTGVREWRGSVGVIASGEAIGTGIVPGKLWVNATWEPAPGEDFPPDELRKIFDACYIQVPHAITVSQSGE